MRMITTCFARALQRCTSRIDVHFLLTFQEVRPISKTRNQLYLIAEVGLGRAGAVLCLEASRLARSSSDWYRLIEICALSDTLVIDEDGVYDPGQYNDRLL